MTLPTTGAAATGYLGRMAARATGTGLGAGAAAAAPRVRSWFEPVPAEVGEASVEPDPTRPVGEPATDVDPDPPPTARRHGRGPRQRPARVAGEPLTSEPPSSEPPFSEAPSGELPGRSDARPASSYRFPGEQPQEPLRAADGPASGLGPRADLGRAEERRAVSEPPRGPSARVAGSAEGPPVPAGPVPAHPVTPAVVRTPAPTPRAAEEPREPDVVVVSVGRIDVRAVLAPTPPRPAPHSRPAPADTLSLHDYLRGRREG